MSGPDKSYEPVSRTKIDIIGLDLLTIKGRDAVRTAVDSGELARLSEIYETLAGLPWLFRWYFSFTRFFSAAHGWFLPFRADDDPTYPPSAAFLHHKFTPAAADISGPVARAIDLLTQDKPASDEELSATFMDAMFLRFAPGLQRVPDDILDDAGKQVVGLVDSFLPHRFLPGKPSIRDIYNFAEKTLQDSGEGNSLPREAVVDVAHALLAPSIHGAKVLRALADSVDEDVEQTLSSRAPTETVLRVPKRDTTLGGLLPADQPAVRGKTVIRLDIRIAASETKNVAWVFGTGDENRRCAAEPAVKEFFKAVLDGLRAKKAAGGTA